MRLVLGRKHFKYKVPAGLIIFARPGETPENTEPFTAPNNRMVIGAGDSFSVGDIGGSNAVVSYGGSTESGGAHYGGNPDVQPSGGSGVPLFDGPHVGHSHSYGSATFIQEKDNLSLVKITKSSSELPAGGIVLSAQNQTGLSNIFTGGDYIGVSGVTGHINKSAYLALGGAGAHDHKYSYAGIGGSVMWCTRGDKQAGSHGGSIQLTITDRLKSFLLSIWESASSRLDPADNMIAMWESHIMPVGWNLCDGQNGTVDLRDCFIRGCIGGHEAIAPTGSNQVDIAAVSGSITHNAPHSHYNGQWATDSYSSTGFNHTDYDWTHSHSYSLPAQNNIPWLPPYYALNFIQRRL